MTSLFGRRDVLTLLCGAAIAAPALLPIGARAQPAMPVIGVLGATSSEFFADRLRAFRDALQETGFVEGDNLTIAYRWADGQPERLPELAADLVRRKVAVIVTIGSTAAVLAAKSATATIPIVFVAAEDPVKLGLVTSLARPGANLTGVNFFVAELVAKRLELLRELVPGAVRVAVLVNPANTTNTESTVRDAHTAARDMGLQIRVVNASSSQEIDAAFATLAQERPDALFVGPDALFTSRRVQLILLTARHAIPAVYPVRDTTEVGGLLSYGPSLSIAFRQLGVYAGRILKGAKPADLPVVQAAKFELVINAQTARVLGLTVPPTLLSIADEVIE